MKFVTDYGIVSFKGWVSMIKINNDWQDFFERETKKDYYLKLRNFLKNEYNNYTVYPPMEEIFNAFKITPLSKVKVVILGQDPYYNQGQAMGLSFSVKDGIKPPPSLVNIYREISNDLDQEINISSGNLTRWAEQGVFLLNTTLTVRDGEPLSHKGHGWEIFTDNVIRTLNENDNPKVFLLWGNNAKAKKNLITNKNHLILEAGHPSPLSARYFYGCRHFSKTNDFLIKNGLKPIKW